MNHLGVMLISLLVGWFSMPLLAQSVAKVVVVQGDVSVALNSEVDVAQTITTGEDGYVFLRVQDGSLLILRPKSSMTIEDYAYNPDNPSQNRMRYKLNYGVVRSISGAGLDANKNAYRLNTPVAAIGVRGTDFVVSSTLDKTMVSLNQGSVVVAPFSDSCSPAAVGVCSEGALELNLNLTKVLAEVTSGAKSAVMVSVEDALTDSPDTKSQPSKLEPSKGSHVIKLNTSSIGINQASSESLADAIVLDRTNELTKVLDEKRVILPVLTEPAKIEPLPVDPLPVDPLPAPMPTLVWGDRRTLTGQQGQLIAANQDYMIYRTERADLTRETGKAIFLLDQALVNYGQVNSANLTIDFGQRRFETGIEHQFQQTTTQLKAVGDVTQDGRLFSDWKQGTNMTVTGAIGGSANQEASYLFKQQSNGNHAPISGIVHWQR